MLVKRGDCMNILISTVICFLAVYGALQLLIKLMTASRDRNKSVVQQAHIVLSVKNQEDTIENMIRAIAWDPRSGEVVAIDLGSDDETPEILNRLEQEYSFLHCMNKEEYIDYISKS